jgi:serine/threonine-protein kinase
MGAASEKKKVFHDRYEVLTIVGRGSASVVYHARYLEEPRDHVALKVLVHKSREVSRSDLLRKEALAMVTSRHKYVIQLHDFHSVGELCYLSMEYAPLGDLRKFSNSQASGLDSKQASLFLRQAALGLSHVHKAGIFHRDIKPDNILVKNERSIRLGDFGVAVLSSEEAPIEELQKGVGTMNYMAPEVLEGTRYDEASDLYALGVSFYELLAGKHPFSDAPLAEQLEIRKDDQITPLHELRPDVPENLSLVIKSLMSFKAEDRIKRAEDVALILIGEKEAPKTQPLKAAPPSSSEEDPEAKQSQTETEANSPKQSNAAEERRALMKERIKSQESAIHIGTKEKSEQAEEDAKQPEALPPIAEEAKSVESTITRERKRENRGTSTFESLAARKKRNQNILFVLAFLVSIFIGSVLFNSGGNKEYSKNTDLTEKDSNLLTPVLNENLQFPALPKGSYYGVIDGLFGQEAVPVLFLSNPKDDEYRVLLGISGAKAGTASIEESSIQVSIDGMFLNFFGRTSEVGIEGIVQDMISKKEGTWLIRPVR